MSSRQILFPLPISIVRAHPQPYRMVTGKYTGHGGYIARGIKYMTAGIRPTKEAAGMTFTAARSGQNMSDAVRRRSIFGVMDAPVRPKARVRVFQEPCPCCGSKRPVTRLTPAGRAWLDAQKLARAARAAL